MTLKKIVQVVTLVWCISSCNGQSKKGESCLMKFKAARQLAYGNPDRKTALDSALVLVNQINQCDSIKRAVVDFKISLLLSLQRYQQALVFIDSLDTNDFFYAYKKNITYKGIIALKYGLQGDKVKRDSVYKVIDADLEKYIDGKTLPPNEFKEVYTELLGVKQMYLNPNQLDSAVELLIKKYPDKESFFEFFKAPKNQ